MTIHLSISPRRFDNRSLRRILLVFFAINDSTNNESITKLVYMKWLSIPLIRSNLKAGLVVLKLLYTLVRAIYMFVYNTIITRIKNQMVLVVSQENRPLHITHFLKPSEKVMADFHVRHYSRETWLLDSPWPVRGGGGQGKPWVWGKKLSYF